MTSTIATTCPVCRQPAGFDPHAEFEWYKLSCSRCGRFLLHAPLKAQLETGERQAWWFRLSAWIRERCERGEAPPRFEGELLDLRDATPERTITEQLDLMLKFVEKQQSTLGDYVRFDAEKAAPLVWVRNRAEVKFLLSSLRHMGRLDPEAGAGVQASNSPEAARLTAHGLQRLEEISRTQADGKQLFVAMWFATHLDDAYERGIRKGIRDAGYDALRLDRGPPHGERIDAKILVEIKRSRAVVADATGLRPNVLYEAGYAEGLGKPVVWTVSEEFLNAQPDNKLPFDTRQLLHILWKSPEHLASQLTPVLQHRLGDRRK